ncbi:MAG: excinuclease ABC subunit UvrC [Candidatus Eremiobacteraeota bacterium]|nr:excinuclease ABC subunit UvrC [Candidatus Eremiobacteraeota bacterium]
MTTLQEQLERLPAEPGVYQMLGRDGEVLYVGKAVDLRNRVRSYFQPGRAHHARTDAMVERVQGVRTIIVRSEAEALLLEANLIKQHKPPFNVRLKDDKKYPYLKVTLAEAYPRVIFTRKLVDDGSRYYGPYTNAAVLRDSINLIRRVFPLRTCRLEDIGIKYHRPCLQYHIKRCMAPCAGLQTREQYAAIVAEVVLFLEGRQGALVEKLEAQMREAADHLSYEFAARLRDRIAEIKRVMARQEIVWRSKIDLDVVAGAHGQGISCMELFFVRAGKLVGQEHFIVEGTEGRSPDEILASFVAQYYATAPNVPQELMLEAAVPDQQALCDALSLRRGRRVRVLVPRRGMRAEFMETVRRNAEQHLKEYLTKTAVADERAAVSLDELAAALDLPSLPARIEAFDISHVQGTNVVGSMVVFEDGRPKKSDYRRFKIQGAEVNDDPANMAQLLRRRLRYIAPLADGVLDKRAGGEDKKFGRRPNLLLIDGGRTQLDAVVKVLAELDLVAMPVAALAKQFEELYLPDVSEPALLPRNSPALHLVQRIRDEAHRFAVSYHRTLRGKAQVVSGLDGVAGVGPSRKRALVRAFGSAAAVKRATVDEIAAVPGISKALAETIRDALREK